MANASGRQLFPAHDRAWLPQAWYALTASEGWDRTNRDIEERCALMLRAILAKNLKGQFYVNCKVLPDDPHSAHYSPGIEITDDGTAHTIFMDSFADVDLNTRTAPAKLVRCYVEQPTSPPPARIALAVHVRSVLCWIPLYSAGIQAKHVVVVDGAPYAAVWMCFSMSQKSDGRLQCTGPSWQLALEEELVSTDHPPMQGVDEGTEWADAPTLLASQSEAEPFFPGSYLIPPLLRYLDPRRLPPAWTNRHSHEQDGLDLLARETMATTLAHRQNCVIIPPAVADAYNGPRLWHKAQNCRTFSFTGNKSKKATPDFNAAQEKLTNFVNSDAKDHARFPEDLCVAPVFFEYPILSLPAMKMNVSVFAAYMWMPAAFVREAFVSGKLTDVIVSRVGGDEYARCALHVKPVKEQSGSGITWSTSWWVAENVPALKVLRGVDDGGYPFPPLAVWVRDPSLTSPGLHVDETITKAVSTWDKSTAGRGSVDMFVLRDCLSVCMRACAPNSARDRVKWVRGVNSAVYDGLISKAGQIILTPSIMHQGVLRPLLGLVYQIRKGLVRTEAGETLNLLICAIHCGLCAGTAVGGCTQKPPAIADAYDEGPEKRVMALLRAVANLSDRGESLALVDGFTAFLSVWSPVADTANPSFQAALTSVRANIAAERKQDTAVAQANLDDLSWLEDEAGEGGKKGGKGKKGKGKGKSSSGASGAASAPPAAGTSNGSQEPAPAPVQPQAAAVKERAPVQKQEAVQVVPDLDLDPVLTAAVRLALVDDGRGSGRQGEEGEEGSWELVGSARDKDKKGKDPREEEREVPVLVKREQHVPMTMPMPPPPQAQGQAQGVGGKGQQLATGKAAASSAAASTKADVQAARAPVVSSHTPHSREDPVPSMQPALAQAPLPQPPQPQPAAVTKQVAQQAAAGTSKPQQHSKWLSKVQGPVQGQGGEGGKGQGQAKGAGAGAGAAQDAEPPLSPQFRRASTGMPEPVADGSHSAAALAAPLGAWTGTGGGGGNSTGTQSDRDTSSGISSRSTTPSVGVLDAQPQAPRADSKSSLLPPGLPNMNRLGGPTISPAQAQAQPVSSLASPEDEDLKGILQALGLGEQGFDGAGAALVSSLSPMGGGGGLTSGATGSGQGTAAAFPLSAQTEPALPSMPMWEAQNGVKARAGSSRLSSWTNLPTTPESLSAAVDEALQESGASVDLVVNWVLCKAQAGLLPRYTHLAGPDMDGNKRKLCDLLVKGVLSTKATEEGLAKRVWHAAGNA